MSFKLLLVCCLIIVLTAAVTAPLYFLFKGKPVLQYTYQIVNTYPHDENAFTQGLVFENGVLYEGTGRYGNSTLRCVELETGKIVQTYALSKDFFGEGITIFKDKIIQLTWVEHKGFIYNKTSFELLREFNYSTQGWGITNDGHRLIMSDGTENLYFLNPETFEKIGQIEVQDKGNPVIALNELEYIKGDVYANIWGQEKIAMINPQSGQVKAWINFTGIQKVMNRTGSDVLNGIAYDAQEDRLFITGKCWPQLLEIKLVAVQ